MQFYAELKRRNVFRVGTAYVVVSWLILQVIDVIGPIVALPDSVSRTILLVIAVGFFPALVFAWLYELTPEGVKRDREVDHASPAARRSRQRLDRAIIAVLVLIIGIMAAERFWPAPSPDPTTMEQAAPATAESPAGSIAQPREKSIAVLPFENQGAAGENTQFFSDGIHDDLLTRLSRIRELKVISRTSVMAYRDTTKNMREIGRELGVAHLLEGRVQQAGNRIRIHVQLIDAATDDHLWANRYDAEITTDTIFRIQGEIARTISAELEATLSESEIDRIGYAPTKNLDAYRAVLLSRQYEERHGTIELQRAARHAREAVELDPDYADAHVALAVALTSMVNNGSLERVEAADEIAAAIERAMSIDPANAAAWSALGYYRSSIERSEFAPAFEKALELDPGDAKTMTHYGFAMQQALDPEKALDVLLRAAELDPLSIDTLFLLGRSYETLQQHDRAREYFARIREIHPDSPLGYAPVNSSYMEQGRIDLGLYWMGQAQAIDPGDFELGASMLYSYSLLEHWGSATGWSLWLDGHITSQPLPLAMQAMHYYLSGGFELALQYANLAINLDLENRWGSEAIFMRIKRDEAISNGDPGPGIALFSQRYPELAADKPAVGPENLPQALSLGLLLKLDGQHGRSRKLVETAIDALEIPFTTAGPHRFFMVPGKAEALAILGRNEEALTELERVVDAGWRVDWRWTTDMNASFNGIRENPRFKALVQRLAEDIAQQRANVISMEEEGTIAPPAPLPENGLLGR